MRANGNSSGFGRAGRPEHEPEWRTAMRLLKHIIVAGVIGAFLVAAPVRQAAAQGVDDDALEARIESEFEASPSLAARNIDIEVKQGTATLTGKVRTAQEKDTAEKIASEVRGVG